MTNRQQRRLSMNRSTLEILKREIARWQTLTPFANAVNKFETSIKLRDSNAAIQEIPTKGITKATTITFTTAIDAVLGIADSGVAYALATNDTVLYSRLNFTRSYLLSLPQNVLPATLQQMADALTAVRAQLTRDYGVTAADLTAMQTRINDVTAAIPDTRNQISTRGAAGNAIKVQEDEAKNALEQIDRLIRRFLATLPDWVQAYTNSRKIVDAGGKKGPVTPPNP